jgi:iron complex outermembrane receptor protein
VPGEFAVEWQAAGPTVVNDVNSDRAGGYGIVNLRWLHAEPLGEGLRLEVLARIDNLANRKYAGSVIVNDANGRYFETGAPLTGLLGLRLIRTW